jgi:hypothetical protein
MEKSYYLENIYQTHKEHPRTFLTPTKQEIQNLKVGDLVRVFFVFNFQPDDGCRAERMWLVLSKINGDEYKGFLTNQPVYIKDLQVGEEITFNTENIASVKVEPLFDESKIALITKKALNLEQINWVLRSDDLHNATDSGWQLYYGDETEEYIDDARNIKLIKLADVLAFEPRLEKVFASKEGTAFEWDEETTDFIHVTDE